MAEGSKGVPSHVKYLPPMPSMTHPDGNGVVQIQTHVLKPGKSQKLQSQSCCTVLEGEAGRLHSTEGLQYKTTKWEQVSTKR